ncbi:thiamine pyrophosphate-dependent dehydrogenase E1 component subunit alpha [Thermodesulfobacteriota bacterium]
MLRIRMCEESLVDPIHEGKIKCPVHLCSGEEAIAAGVCAAIDNADYIFGNHRSHGHFIAKGGKISELVAEVFGKKTGCSKGRGGSMHLIGPECGMMGSAPIVAGTISLSLGAALGCHIRKDKRIAVSFFGDGATGEGVLYESLNFASLHSLPIIFVCENNYYATHMPIADCRPDCKIADIAHSFGIQNSQIDGNDVLAVYETAVEAVDFCRRGQGPFFIEALTYRLRGHVGPDDNIQGAHTDIRALDEIEMWKQKDPIIVFEKRLLNEGVISDLELNVIKNEIIQELRKAHFFAQNSPYPPESELNSYVFK